MNASQVSLEVLYEDDVVLAVNKPAGLVVHPTYKNAAGTLLDVLRGCDPAARFFLAGRLDRLTSGVVIAVKSRDAYVLRSSGLGLEVDKDYLPSFTAASNLCAATSICDSVLTRTIAAAGPPPRREARRA